MREYRKPSGQVVRVAESSEAVAKAIGWIPVEEERQEDQKEPAKRGRKPKQES